MSFLPRFFIIVSKQSQSISWLFVENTSEAERDEVIENYYIRVKSGEFQKNYNLDKLHQDIKSKIKAAPDNEIKYNEVKRQQTKIWNYELTGSSKKSSVGKLLDAADDFVSFFKW